MDRFQQRRDTLENWLKYDPVLLEGETGYVLDSGYGFKIGDGVKKFSQLEWSSDITVVQELGNSTTGVVSQKVTTDLAVKSSDTKIFIPISDLPVIKQSLWVTAGGTVYAATTNFGISCYTVVKSGIFEVVGTAFGRNDTASVSLFSSINDVNISGKAKKVILENVQANEPYKVHFFCEENDIIAITESFEGTKAVVSKEGTESRIDYIENTFNSEITDAKAGITTNSDSITHIFADLKGVVKAGVNLKDLSDSEVKYGYYADDGNFKNTAGTIYSDWITSLIRIVGGAQYKWATPHATPGSSNVYFDKDMRKLGSYSVTTSGQYAQEQSFDAPDNCAFFAIQTTKGSYSGVYIKSTKDIKKDNLALYERIIGNESRISQLEGDKKSYTLLPIPYIFGIVNPALYSREYVVRVFPESFLKSKPDLPCTINYRRDAAFNTAKKSNTLYEKNPKTVTFRGDTYKDKSADIDFHVLNELVVNNKNIRCCLFGVSFDGINYKNDDGTLEPGGSSTSSFVEKFMVMGGIDTSGIRNYVSIGTIPYGGNFTYKDVTTRIYGCSEARGGNTGINYLRQPIHFSPREISYDPNVSGTSATGLVMWYMNGLRYRVPYNVSYNTEGIDDYGSYEFNKEKIDAMRCTPFGKYHHDYSEELWEFCNKRGWITKVSGMYSKWTGSNEQKSIIDLCMDYITDNPDYPFYDRDTARTTSYVSGQPKAITDNTQYSFNFNKFISRYRTMDNKGERLLSSSTDPHGETVVGSDGITYTIGSKIVNVNMLSDINVCSPTHVIWDMSYNDWGFYADSGWSSGSDSFALTQLFISAIQDQLGNEIKIGVKAKRGNGSFFPSTWEDVAIGQQYNGGENDHLINYNMLLISAYSDLDKKVNWIPVFPVSIPFSTNYTQKFEDFVYGSCLVTSSTDITHEGLRSAKAMAFQIYGWLAYTDRLA